MSIWIAVLAGLMIVGSISWAMPSKRDKLLAALRKEAFKRGLTVRLVDQKLMGSLFSWLTNYHGYVLYEKRLPSKLKLDRVKIRVVRLSEDESAHEIDQQDSLREFIMSSDLLQGLPSSIEAVVMSSGSISILWKEQGSLENVAKIEHCLAVCIEEKVLWQ